MGVAQNPEFGGKRRIHLQHAHQFVLPVPEIAVNTCQSDTVARRESINSMLLARYTGIEGLQASLSH